MHVKSFFLNAKLNSQLKDFHRKSCETYRALKHMVAFKLLKCRKSLIRTMFETTQSKAIDHNIL